MQLRTRKSASAFLHGRALVNPEIESKRMYMCVYVFFFILILSFSSRIRLRFSYSRRTRRGCFISTPVAIVPFVSQPALHASRRRAFPPTFSIYLLYPLPLFFSLPLCHPCSSWQIRAVDESTRRYLDVSASTRLMRDADVFIHRRTFPILTNDAPHRTLLV